MAKKLLKKIALAATATALTLNLAWNLLPNYTKHKVTNPFSHNSFMIGYNNQIFEYDKELGFKFPKGKLITITGFSTLEEILRNSNNYQCIILSFILP